MQVSKLQVLLAFRALSRYANRKATYASLGRQLGLPGQFLRNIHKGVSHTWLEHIYPRMYTNMLEMREPDIEEFTLLYRGIETTVRLQGKKCLSHPRISAKELRDINGGLTLFYAGFTNPSAPKIQFVNPEGIVEPYVSIAALVDNHKDLSRQALQSVVLGTSKSHKGWRIKKEITYPFANKISGNKSEANDQK